MNIWQFSPKIEQTREFWACFVGAPTSGHILCIRNRRFPISSPGFLSFLRQSQPPSCIQFEKQFGQILGKEPPAFASLSFGAPLNSCRLSRDWSSGVSKPPKRLKGKTAGPYTSRVRIIGPRLSWDVQIGNPRTTKRFCIFFCAGAFQWGPPVRMGKNRLGRVPATRTCCMEGRWCQDQSREPHSDLFLREQLGFLQIGIGP